VNTDNMAISGRDDHYGPVPFNGPYDPATVFSSIDTRAARVRHQPAIAQWKDLARSPNPVGR